MAERCGSRVGLAWVTAWWLFGSAEVRALASIASAISGSEAHVVVCGRRIEVW